MATLYRFSFENEIVPVGITIGNGQIWSGFGRFGSTTSALVASSSANDAQATVVASLPPSTTGVRGSYYTKYAGSGSYPATLATIGPITLSLVNSTTAEIKNGLTQVATQDITQLQDNRWNLVRFQADFGGGGNSTTASFEFNGINLTWEGASGATSASAITIGSVKGTLASLDDVGINDNSGSIDNGVPGSIRGMVGGMTGDGDIQNWQQNVASLPPTKISIPYQGNLLYIPKTDVVLCQNVFADSPTSSSFTTINAQTSVTRSKWTSTYNGVGFVVQASVYSPYDHKVYLYGSSGTNLRYVKYDPELDAVVGSGSMSAGDLVTDYAFQSDFTVLSATYSEINSRILILTSCSSPEQLVGSVDYASPRVVSHNLRDNSFSLGTYSYQTQYIIAGVSNTVRPSGKIFYNEVDKKVYIYHSEASGLLVIDPTTLFYVNPLNPLNGIFWVGGSGPEYATSSFCLSDINNHLYIASYNSLAYDGDIWQISLDTRTGSRVIAVDQPTVGTYANRISYIPGRSAILATGQAISYLFNPISAGFGSGTGSIIEFLPQIFNANDSVYCPKNAAIVIAASDAVYNFQGSLQSSVVNALMNNDTLKAGATASGDICTIAIAKPTGSFTSNYTYEGMNVRVDNASSLATASLLLGVRDNGINIPLSSSITTWGNSQQSTVRSIFTSQNSGSAKWTEAQFKNVQFYMEAGPEL